MKLKMDSNGIFTRRPFLFHSIFTYPNLVYLTFREV